MHASIACVLLYEDYVWVSLVNAMKAKQSKAILVMFQVGLYVPHSANLRPSNTSACGVLLSLFLKLPSTRGLYAHFLHVLFAP
jgi:hypothetical protein